MVMRRPKRNPSRWLLLLIVASAFASLSAAADVGQEEDADSRIGVHNAFFMGRKAYFQQNKFLKLFQQMYEVAMVGSASANPIFREGPNLTSHNNYLLKKSPPVELKWILVQDDPSIAVAATDNVNKQESTLAATKIHNQQLTGESGHLMWVTSWGNKNGDGNSFEDFLSHNKAILDGYLHYLDQSNANSDSSKATFLVPTALVYDTLYQDCVTAGVDPLTASNCPFQMLFADDNMSPSGLGSYVLALTVITSMMGVDTTYLPSLGVNEEIAMALKDGVKRAIVASMEEPYYLRYPFQPPPNTLAPGEDPNPSTEVSMSLERNAKPEQIVPKVAQANDEDPEVESRQSTSGASTAITWSVLSVVVGMTIIFFVA